ncbi:MAG: SBBP repeat-containing protein, partial [Acidobacteriota bacterium]
MTSTSRSRRAFARYSLALPVLLLAFDSSGHRGRTGTHPFQRVAGRDAPITAHTRAAFGLAQAGFETNVGQTDARVKFFARGNGYSLFLTDTEAVFSLTDPTEQPTRTVSADRAAGGAGASPARPNATLRMKLLGAQSPAKITGLDRRGTRNYFSGSDRSQWRTDIPAYGSVRYANVYPGIDLLYHDSQRELEYDFIVAPGIEPRAVRLGFEGIDTMQLDAAGDLVLGVAGRTIRQQKPTIYQEVNGRRRQVAGEYRLAGLREVGFDVASYDRSRPLIIDPVLVYSTYLGSINPPGGVITPHTTVSGIAVDQAGNAYVTGSSGFADFPTVNPLPPTIFGRPSVFVAKFTRDGSLEYLTFLGGTIWDDQRCQYCGAGSGVTGIAVDATGSASIVGSTPALDFPLTPGAFLTPDGRHDGFLTKLSPDGNALAYSTIVLTDCQACLQSIALDSEGGVWMAGRTTRQDLPTVNPLQQAPGGGSDAVIMKVNAAGTGVMYSTYLGGTGDDYAYGVAVDRAGEIYLVGRTLSADFPTKNAAQPNFGGGWGDCWVARMNHAGSALRFSTYLGGTDAEFCGSVAVDGAGNAIVTGSTGSADFPTWNALQPHLNGATSAIVVKLTVTA